MDCIVIDDEKTALEILLGLCNNHGNLNVIGRFLSPIEAIKFLNKNEVRLIFLDIHMPEFSGVDFLDTISQTDCKVILTTSDSNFALEAFEYDCVVDYLLKPIRQERFNKAISKASSTIPVQENPQSVKDDSSEDHLFININKRLIKIDLIDILFIEAKGDYVRIVANNNTYIVHTTLKSLQAKLPSKIFFKSHRSYIVNISAIKEIEENSLVINKYIIPVSKKIKHDLIERLNLL